MDDIGRLLKKSRAAGFPLIDLHVHLKGGLTLEDALARSQRDGIKYGIAVNCGKGFTVQDDAGAREFCIRMRKHPVYVGMQAEGREWTEMFSREAAAEFDYIFTDSMTWTDSRGKRMRLWIAEEVGTIANPQEFMETLVARTVAILECEPIDIYVNPTFLPAVLADQYDRLWTDERMQRVIGSAARNQVAIELNDLYGLPSAKFVKMAKAAGCKFTMGTNNTRSDDLRRCDYGLQMIDACGLVPEDIFVPSGASGSKAITRKPKGLRATAR